MGITELSSKEESLTLRPKVVLPRTTLSNCKLIRLAGEYLEDTEALIEIDTERAHELLMEVVYGDVWDYINVIGE
tara:strand:+ start:2910 stop:3134 length:225 start_codon:yes stop_codon:yes gene_type:complete